MYIRNGEWVIISSIKKKAVNYIKSLQARIFFLFILAGLIPIFLMKYVILENYEELAVDQKGVMLESQCQQIIEQISQTSYVHGEPSSMIDTELGQLAAIYGGRVIIVNSNFRIILDTFGIDEDKVIISEDVLQSFLGSDSVNYNQEYQFLEMTIPIPNRDTSETEGVVIISVPTVDVDSGKAALGNTVLILQITISLLVCLLAFYVSRMLTKPFSKITKSLEEVRGGIIEQEISIPDYTETQLLGRGLQPHAQADEDPGRFQAGICLQRLP